MFLVAVVGEAATSPRVRQLLLRLASVSAVAALLLGLAWLGCETALVADTDNLTATLRALPVVALQTQYGRWFLLRCVLLIAVLPLLHVRRYGTVAAIALAGVALALQPLLGHAGAVGGGAGAELIASEVLHLLAAGAWLGGLLPLLLAIRVLPADGAGAACRAFTPIGLASVFLLGGTAVVQVSSFMGGLPGLFGTGYGHVALVKLGLFVVLLALAALNRLVLTDRLTTTSDARLHMQMSVAAEILLGTLVVITAGFLASRTPGSHEQPVWPFPWRPSAWAFADPAFRNEEITALIATVGGVVVIIVGLGWRRIRWFALGAGAIILAATIPHLDLLFVAAYPTSFFTSPTEFAATAIVHGGSLFTSNCVACHGAQGRGDGPAAKSLPLPPADLTASHFWAHNDGELYWFIATGITAPDGATAMPGFAGTLSSEAIWDIIDYMSAHNAGDTMRRTGTGRSRRRCRSSMHNAQMDEFLISMICVAMRCASSQYPTMSRSSHLGPAMAVRLRFWLPARLPQNRPAPPASRANRRHGRRWPSLSGCRQMRWPARSCWSIRTPGCAPGGAQATPRIGTIRGCCRNYSATSPPIRSSLRPASTPTITDAGGEPMRLAGATHPGTSEASPSSMIAANLRHA